MEQDDGTNPSDEARGGQAGPSRPGGKDFGGSERGGDASGGYKDYGLDAGRSMMEMNSAPLGGSQGVGFNDGAIREAAAGMAAMGLSDRQISRALAGFGVGYSDRTGILGPIDAIAQGTLSDIASRALSGAIMQSSPMAGLLGQVADQYQRGQLTGNYSGFGGLLGGLAGSYLGGNIGADLGGTMQTAQLGMGLGGLGGKLLGSAIGSGQYGTTTQPRDISQEGNGQTMVASSRQVQPMQRSQSIAPLMLGGLQSQPAMTYSVGRRFGIA